MRYKKFDNKGFTLIEVLIAAALGVFLLFAVFYAVGSILSKAILTEKKIDLVNELDKRVDRFMLTGEFEEGTFEDMVFSEVSNSSPILFEFKAVNENFSLDITKKAYSTTNPITDIINQQLGAYMQAANQIYIDAGATTIDQTPELVAEIDVARSLHLSDSTAKWSSNTGVILNLGTTQIVTAVPLDDPPLESGAYLTLAPFTSNDIGDMGVYWRCTAFGFDTELLPSWCVL